MEPEEWLQTWGSLESAADAGHNRSGLQTHGKEGGEVTVVIRKVLGSEKIRARGADRSVGRGIMIRGHGGRV